MKRRTFLLGAAAALFGAQRCPCQPEPSSAMLLNAPLELHGDWGKSLPVSAAAVISRMREACLTGVRLLSDRQPNRIRVDNHTSGSPAVWLHDDGSRIAWIIVDIGERDWCKLAYQFGHELGHVLANSWDSDSKPQPPCQWLEESLVEAFSLRGLGKLADTWEQRPVFKDDALFANAIRRYQRDAVEKYQKVASDQMGDSGMAAWFRENRSALEQGGGRTDPAHAMIPTLLHELESDARSIEDIGALNRWVGRSSVPIHDYLNFWKKSCDDIGAAGRLPKRIADILGVPYAA